MKQLTFFVLVLLGLTTIISCTEKDLVDDFENIENVEEISMEETTRRCYRNTHAWNTIDGELERVLRDCYANATEHCENITDYQTVSLGYLWNGKSPANDFLTVNEQNQIINSAINQAQYSGPVCSSSSASSIITNYDFFIQYVGGPFPLKVGVNVTYACCDDMPSMD